MLRKVASAIALVATASTLVSAEIKFDTPNKTSLQQEISNLEFNVPAPVASADRSASSSKEWTIMVFVNGKNNLEPFALKDMNEMEQVGSSDKVNVVVEAGLISGYGSMPWTGTARFLMKKDSDTNKVTSPALSNLGKVDMGNYQSVIDFVNWAKQTYPAKHYMLVIWNHGAGWLKSATPGTTRGISYDDETNNHINTPQMGQILKAVGHLDVYGSDACLMQMPEVDYEIRNYVDYIVGSEETEPGDGYTYNTFLGPIVANPTMGALEVGKQAVNAYADHYGTEDHTQSLVKSSALDGLVPVINNFVTAAKAANEKALVKSALNQTQSYAYADNKDLWHFMSLYGASTKDSNVKAAAQAVQDYLDNTLILENRSNSNYANSHGLAVYLPATSFSASAYSELQWAKDAQWDEFIKWYQGK